MPHPSPVHGHQWPQSSWTLTFRGLLFDMDGTIIDSTEAIIKHWHGIGTELGVDPNVILATSHGRRSIDVLKEYDESKANWKYVSNLEAEIPRKFRDDAVEIPGSRALLEQLNAVGAPWAIVTSGTQPLVSGWLEVLSLARPLIVVTAEDVTDGKPDPAGYRLGRAKLLGGNSSSSSSSQDTTEQTAAECLVLEDGPAGVQAGKAAGFTVCALATTHSIEQLRAAGADFIVRDMRSVKLDAWDKVAGVVRVVIADAIKIGE